MKVLVPTPEKNCAASLALRMEGIEHDEHVCTGDYGYSLVVAEYWGSGEGFIIVEHDVVPWPGALQQMWDCASSWCGYPYPLHVGRLCDTYGMGCIKFDSRIVNMWPDLPMKFGWIMREWRSLDALVAESITYMSYPHSWHKHYPPVAHARYRHLHAGT